MPGPGYLRWENADSVVMCRIDLGLIARKSWPPKRRTIALFAAIVSMRSPTFAPTCSTSNNSARALHEILSWLPAEVQCSDSGRGAAWLARLLGVQEVPGSNPGGPTNVFNMLQPFS